jgi:hypothetical protein
MGVEPNTRADPERRNAARRRLLENRDSGNGQYASEFYGGHGMTGLFDKVS